MLLSSSKTRNRFVDFTPQLSTPRRQTPRNTWRDYQEKPARRAVAVTGSHSRGNRFKSKALNLVDRFNSPLATFIATALIVATPKQAVSTKATFHSTPYVSVMTTGAGDVSVRRQHRDVPRVYKYLKNYTKEKNPLAMAELLVYGTSYGKTLAAIGARETNMIAGRTGASGEKGKFQLMSNWRPADYNEFDDRQNARLAEKVLKIKIKAKSRGARIKPGTRAETVAWMKGIEGYNGAGPKARAYSQDIVRRVRLINSLA